MKEHFIQQTRDDGTSYWSLKDANEEATGAPDWLRDAVYAAHDGEFPNDWRYEMCQRIAAAIDDGYLTDEDGIGEFADGAVDIYNSDRLQWLAGDLERVTYVDDARAEGLTGESADILEMIGVGQYVCIERMASIILNAWQENRDES